MSAVRRGILQGVCVLAATAQLGGCSSEEAPGPEAAEPDGPWARRAVLITCDTLRADRLGVYGYDRPLTPELDALAREAVVFDEAYSCAPTTGPSLSSLMSGLLPDEIGVSGGNQHLMPPAVTTLAELIRDAGLPTGAIVSNWALRQRDKARGVSQGFEHFDDAMTATVLNRGTYDRIAEETTDAALAWLGTLAESGQDRFFLWVHYQDPHGPYTPPPEVLAELAAEGTVSALEDEPLVVQPKNKGLGGLPAYQLVGDERRPSQLRERYEAEIRYFDRELGRLLDWLRERDWLDDSLLVFTADHGESLGDHDYWFCHGEHVYRDVVRVPCVVRFPAGAPRPATVARDGMERVSAPVGHLDLWPTVLEALGIEPPGRRGLSLFTASLPKGRLQPHTLKVQGSASRWVGVSDGRFRLVVKPDGTRALYNIVEDAAERQDLAAGDPERVQAMFAAWERLRDGGTIDALPQSEAYELDAASLEGLRALGYIGADEDGD